MAADLKGLRVLIVEDESMVALLVEDMLADLGCVTTARAGRLAQALELVAAGGFDFALLDVNLAGERVFPVAEALTVQRVPFAFASGYGGEGLPERFRSTPVVSKPFRIADLSAAVSAALARHAITTPQ